MAQSRTQTKGAYPLQASFAFETPQSPPSTYSEPASNQSSVSRTEQGGKEVPWLSPSQHRQVVPRQDLQYNLGDLSPRSKSPTQPLPPAGLGGIEPRKQAATTGYPLQAMPTRKASHPAPTAPQQKYSTPESVALAPRVLPSAQQSQKTNERHAFSSGEAKLRHRTLSQSYPLQARPSQVFRDDMDIPPRTQVNGLKCADATPKTPQAPQTSASPVASLKPRSYYGAQAVPSPRSSKSVSTQSPQSLAALLAGLPAESRTPPGQVDRPPQGVQTPRHIYPLQVVPAPSSQPSRKPTVDLGQAGQRSDSTLYRNQPLVTPAPLSRSSGETAVSSGRASQEQLKRRQPYPFQGVPQDVSRVHSSVETVSDKAGSRSPSLVSESTKGLPRLPRNIRALKNGRSEFPGRTIVICLDGTGDKFDSDNSNIVHLVSCLKKSDASQITYYQSGIGTYDGGGLSNGLNAALDMAVGSGLGVHVRDAYHFLMQNYVEGDRICLFGFSRGAYTARCLAGMVHKVGLLPAHNTQQLPFAYEYYKDDTENGWEMSGDFKRTFCMDVSIHFIGVFDSVASVGFIPRTLPLSATPWNKANFFRHALALDEHRAKFKAKHFEQKDSIDSSARWQTVADSHDGDGDVDPDTGRRASTKPKFSLSEIAEDGQPIEADSYMRQKRALAQEKRTDVLEVWFAGAHADVGGGAEKNTVRHKLAMVPLRWMLRQCFECDTGIIFKVHRLAEEGLDIHTLWPNYTSLGIPRMGPIPSLLDKYQDGKIAPICRRSSVLQPADKNDPQGPHDVVLWRDDEKRHLNEAWVPEHVEDYFDSISRINDQLVGATAWWILEVWPIKIRVQPSDSEEWVKKVSMNLGRYRAVQDATPNLHWTVQKRIEAMGYKLNVRTARGACWNIVA